VVKLLVNGREESKGLKQITLPMLLFRSFSREP
jgi:hypothetical protein